MPATFLSRIIRSLDVPFNPGQYHQGNLLIQFLMKILKLFQRYYMVHYSISNNALASAREWEIIIKRINGGGGGIRTPAPGTPDLL
ncbi:MAG: hypothetical protein ACOCU0_00980, partial [Bacillota bacterium]